MVHTLDRYLWRSAATVGWGSTGSTARSTTVTWLDKPKRRHCLGSPKHDQYLVPNHFEDYHCAYRVVRFRQLLDSGEWAPVGIHMGGPEVFDMVQHLKSDTDRLQNGNPRDIALDAHQYQVQFRQFVEIQFFRYQNMPVDRNSLEESLNQQTPQQPHHLPRLFLNKGFYSYRFL